MTDPIQTIHNVARQIEQGEQKALASYQEPQPVHNDLPAVWQLVINDMQARGWRVAEAIEAKMKFNEGRPYRHGGKEF